MKWISRAILLVTITLWVLTVVLPTIALIRDCIAKPATGVDARPPMQLLVTSVGWATGISVTSMLVGWLPGRLLGSLMKRREWRSLALTATLVLAPLALPSYVIFYAWWQSWPAESAIYQWVVLNGHMQLGRDFTLALGLVCWSWPLVSLCVIGSAAQRPDWRDDLLSVDGCGFFRRWADRLRSEFRGLLLGGLLVFLATLNNTTCFDLAEMFTFANELRAIQALGASSREVLLAAWPMVALSLGGSVMLWRLLNHRTDFGDRGHARGGKTAMLITAIAWLLSVALPIGLFLSHLLKSRGSLGRVLVEFDSLYQGSAWQTLRTASVSGLLSALVLIGLVLAWQSGSRTIRWLALTMSISWLFLALIPGTLTGIAIHSFATTPFFANGLHLIGPSFVLSLGHLAVFGFVAVLLARWAVATEPRDLRDLRQADGTMGFSQFVRAQYPRLLVAAMPTAIITFVLAVGEIPVTAMVNPPHRVGAGPLALSILNDMHYQRPQTVLVAAMGMMILALVAAAAMTMIIIISRKSSQVRPNSWTGHRYEA